MLRRTCAFRRRRLCGLTARRNPWSSRGGWRRRKSNQLVEKHLSLVQAIARKVKKTLNASIEVDDLVGYGVEGAGRGGRALRRPPRRRLHDVRLLPDPRRDVRRPARDGLVLARRLRPLPRRGARQRVPAQPRRPRGGRPGPGGRGRPAAPTRPPRWPRSTRSCRASPPSTSPRSRPPRRSPTRASRRPTSRSTATGCRAGCARRSPRCPRRSGA